jgi:ribosomal protein L4
LQTLSSTESEYVALCEATKEVVYLRRILKFLGFGQKKPTVIFEDNKSCIQMLKGNRNHKVNKRINPKFHYGRDMVTHGVVVSVLVSTE